jgi:hypothetical protein
VDGALHPDRGKPPPEVPVSRGRSAPSRPRKATPRGPGEEWTKRSARTREAATGGRGSRGRSAPSRPRPAGSRGRGSRGRSAPYRPRKAGSRGCGPPWTERSDQTGVSAAGVTGPVDGALHPDPERLRPARQEGNPEDSPRTFAHRIARSAAAEPRRHRSGHDPRKKKLERPSRPAARAPYQVIASNAVRSLAPRAGVTDSTQENSPRSRDLSASIDSYGSRA